MKNEREEKSAEKRRRKSYTDNDLIMHSEGRIDTDPQGSWTGTPSDPNDAPIQDADDL